MTSNGLTFLFLLHLAGYVQGYMTDLEHCSFPANALQNNIASAEAEPGSLRLSAMLWHMCKPTA